MNKIIMGMIEIDEPPPSVLLWIDDERVMPEGFNYHAKTSSIAQAIIDGAASGKWVVEKISFDHDLGSFGNGYDVACKVEEFAMQNKIPRIEWTVHSMNPVGRVRIIQAMKNADKAWDKQGL